VLTGTGRIPHLEENLASLALPPLPDDALARLDRLFGKVA
jgi:aryl-alcohol dehydrogenase-like predicted oxidoreductase